MKRLRSYLRRPREDMHAERRLKDLVLEYRRGKLRMGSSRYRELLILTLQQHLSLDEAKRMRAELAAANDLADREEDDHARAVVRKRFAAVVHTFKLVPRWLLALFEEDIIEDLVATGKEDGNLAAIVQLGLFVVKFGLRRTHRCTAKSSRADNP